MNLYIGNLSYDVTEEELKAVFQQYGNVTSVAIIKDKNTGKSRGFGFVEMATDDEGNAAVNGLSGQDLKGRTLKVSVAYPKQDKKPFFGKEGGGGRDRDRRPRY